MSKVIFNNYTAEDYRRLMLRSSRIDGESYPRPLIDTDPEKWAEMFDATKVKEPSYLLANIITFVVGISTVLFYHFG